MSGHAAQPPQRIVLANNLGGVSVLELGGITAEVVTQLHGYDIRRVRILSGTYMTSLNGLGFSISLLNVVNTNMGGPSMIELLDDPSEATGWVAPVSKESWDERNQATREDTTSGTTETQPRARGVKYDARSASAALQAGLGYVIAVEPDVTHFDSVVGDGDCGIGLKRGAEAMLLHLESNPLSGDAVVDVANIVSVVQRAMDGTSGAIYAIFLNALVHSLSIRAPGDMTPELWAESLKQSCEALSKYTPAKPGDRTLVDALYPFVETLAEVGEVKKAAQASIDAAEATQGMVASLGRSVYIGGSGFQTVPDPGAWGLACFFLGVAGLPKPARSGEEGWETV